MKNDAMNQPITNPELKKAIQTLKAEQNRENETKMFAALKTANLLAPTIFDVDLKQKNGKIEVPQGAQIKFVLVNANDGKVFFPLFTDMEEAKKMEIQADGNLQYIVRSIKDYDTIFNNVQNNAFGVVINPKGENIVLPKQLILDLNKVDEEVKKTAQKILQQPTQVSFSEPNVYPTTLVNAVYEECKNISEVKKVWLKSMSQMMSMSFALFVEADKNDPALLNKLQTCATQYSKNVPVVVLFVTDELRKNVIKDAVALYDKDMEF